MIRVGTRVGNKDPTYEGFENIVVLMRSHSKWGEIGPYLLKDENGCIFENVWQFSKIYKTVPYSKQYYSRYNKSVTWEWPAERHMDGDEVLPAYWKWREAGFNNEVFVRYPVGTAHRHLCEFTLWKNEGNTEWQRLSYVEARKKVYASEYKRLARKHKLYQELLSKLRRGINLLIIEVDGPKEESLPYYMKKYGVDKNWIENGSILITKANLDIMVNDERHCFGHGYCLAEALLEDTEV